LIQAIDEDIKNFTKLSCSIEITPGFLQMLFLYKAYHFLHWGWFPTAKCLFTLEKSAKGVSMTHPLVKYANEEEYQMKDQKKKNKNLVLYKLNE
jgi:hypothetical protein